MPTKVPTWWSESAAVQGARALLELVTGRGMSRNDLKRVYRHARDLAQSLENGAFPTTPGLFMDELLTKWLAGRDEPAFVAFLIMKGMIKVIYPDTLLFQIRAALRTEYKTLDILLEAITHKLVSVVQPVPNGAYKMRLELKLGPQDMGSRERLELVAEALRQDDGPGSVLRAVFRARATAGLVAAKEVKTLGAERVARLLQLRDEIPSGYDPETHRVLWDFVHRAESQGLRVTALTPARETMLRALVGAGPSGLPCPYGTFRELWNMLGFFLLHLFYRPADELRREPSEFLEAVPVNGCSLKEFRRLREFMLDPHVRELHRLLVRMWLGFLGPDEFMDEYHGLMRAYWADERRQRACALAILQALKDGHKRLAYLQVALGFLSRNDLLLQLALEKWGSVTLRGAAELLLRADTLQLRLVPPSPLKKEMYIYPEEVYALMAQQRDYHDLLMQLAAAGFITVTRGFLEATLPCATGDSLYTALLASPAALRQISAEDLRAVLEPLEEEPEASTADMPTKIAIFLTFLARREDRGPARGRTMARTRRQARRGVVVSVPRFPSRSRERRRERAGDVYVISDDEDDQ